MYLDKWVLILVFVITFLAFVKMGDTIDHLERRVRDLEDKINGGNDDDIDEII